MHLLITFFLFRIFLREFASAACYVIILFRYKFLGKVVEKLFFHFMLSLKEFLFNEVQIHSHQIDLSPTNTYFALNQNIIYLNYRIFLLQNQLVDFSSFCQTVLSRVKKSPVCGISNDINWEKVYKDYIMTQNDSANEGLKMLSSHKNSIIMQIVEVGL